MSEQKTKEFNEKITKLRAECPEIKSIIVQWECEWKRKSRSGELAIFLKESFVKRPKRRLVPCDAGNYTIVNFCLFLTADQ